MVGNSWFKKKDGTWLRIAELIVVDRALIDYVLLPKRMLGRLLDVKMRRGEGMSDHFLVAARLKLVGMEGWREDLGCEKCVEGE